MAWDHVFFDRIYKVEFSKQLSLLVEAFEKRVIPAFDGIEQEANKVAQKAWDDFMSSPATGEKDPADFAESAKMAGVDYYVTLAGIRGGMVNLCAVALYHAFEQQAWVFYRQEVLYEVGDYKRKSPDEKLPKRFELKCLRERAQKDCDIDMTKFLSWPKVDELVLAANTVKHGKGQSSLKLHDSRPDLFKHPSLRECGLGPTKPQHDASQPLIGDGLYIAFKDIREYREALLQFWEELSEAIKNTDRQL